MVERSRQFIERYKYLFLWTVIIAIVTHGFLLTNKLLSHDEVTNVIGEWMWPAQLGRFTVIFIKMTLPIVSNPWFYGLITILFLALSVVLLADLFHIDSPIMQGLFAATVVSFPVLTAILNYMYTAPAYGLAIFLGTLTLVLIVNYGDNWLFLGIAALLLAVTIGIYQAYVSFVISLIAIYLMVSVLDGAPAPDVLRALVKALVTVVVGLVLYLVLNQVFLSVWQLQLSDYQNISNALNLSISGIIDGAIAAYANVWQAFTQFTNGIILDTWGQVLYAGLLITIAMIVLRVMAVHRLSFSQTVLFFGLVVTLPLALCFVYLINSQMLFYSLTAFSYVVIPMFCLVVLERFTRQLDLGIVFRGVGSGIIILLVAQQMNFASDNSLRMYFAYEHSAALTTTIMAQVRQTPGYTLQTEVAFVGQLSPDVLESMDYRYSPGTKQVAGSMTAAELFNAYSRMRFIAHFNGSKLVTVDDATIEQIKQSQEFLAMPSYPDYGSIRMIDGRVVVKLSQ